MAGFVLALAIVFALGVPRVAAATVCGDATDDGTIDASDALITLRCAVGVHSCSPSLCDCNDSGRVTATDAMEILKEAVGSGSGLHCPASEGSTTLPSTSTTLAVSDTTSTTVEGPGACGNDRLEAGEDCEPPFSFCRGGCNPDTGICVDMMCSESCRCPAPRCGDDLVDPGEDCDPPGSPCASGTCGAGCTCLE